MTSVLSSLLILSAEPAIDLMRDDETVAIDADANADWRRRL
jgi:hypothetical protein